MASPGLARIILLLANNGLLAQSPPTRLLTFDISAIDQRGNLVSDVTTEELRVTDAGRRQQIIYFRRGQDVTAPQRALTREYSNRAYGTFPHATVVMLDQLNTRIELAGPEWEHVARSLQRAGRRRLHLLLCPAKERCPLPCACAAGIVDGISACYRALDQRNPAAV